MIWLFILGYLVAVFLAAIPISLLLARQKDNRGLYYYDFSELTDDGVAIFVLLLMCLFWPLVIPLVATIWTTGKIAQRLNEKYNSLKALGYNSEPES